MWIASRHTSPLHTRSCLPRNEQGSRWRFDVCSRCGAGAGRDTLWQSLLRPPPIHPLAQKHSNPSCWSMQWLAPPHVTSLQRFAEPRSAVVVLGLGLGEEQDPGTHWVRHCALETCMHRGRRHTAYLGLRGGGVGGSVRRGGRVYRGDHMVRCGGGRVRRVVRTGVRRGGAVCAIVVLTGGVNSPCSLYQETIKVENMSTQTVGNATTTTTTATTTTKDRSSARGPRELPHSRTEVKITSLTSRTGKRRRKQLTIDSQRSRKNPPPSARTSAADFSGFGRHTAVPCSPAGSCTGSSQPVSAWPARSAGRRNLPKSNRVQTNVCFRDHKQQP